MNNDPPNPPVPKPPTTIELLARLKDFATKAKGTRQKLPLPPTRAEQILTLIDTLTEDLTDMVAQNCHFQEGVLDSMALSTNADAMLTLADLGKLTITEHEGRRVLAKWSEPEQPLSETTPETKPCSS